MTPLRQRRPRKREPEYLDFIAALHCVVCFTEPVECAHVRYAEACPKCHGKGCGECEETGDRYGKRHVGGSEKPSDRWTLPLCPTDHRNHKKNAQHQHNERQWWQWHQIDPLELCAKLQAVYNLGPNRPAMIETGMMIIADAIREKPNVKG